MKANSLQADMLDRVVVTADRSLDSVCNIANPNTGLGMKFSVRTVAALSMLGRDTSRLSSFTDEAAAEPSIAQAREKIEVQLADIHPITRTQVRLQLKGGSSIEAEHDSGRPETDLALQRTRLQKKFKALSGEVLGVARADQLLERVDTLETQPDISIMMRLAARN